MNENDKKIMFSSAKTEWETPQDFFDDYNAVYNFTLDVCATAKNTKCDYYFDMASNGLEQSWEGERCWCNPPYGRGMTDKWVKKAYEESLQPNTLVVMLLPARTDTKWFHEYVYPYGRIHFIKGRLKFGGCKTSAPFPSLAVVFPKEPILR